MNAPLAVYVHIPFCKSKCLYCDFNSYAGMDSFHASYFVAVDQELEKYLPTCKDRGIRSIFFGGGTPTAVDPKYLTSILSKLKPFLVTEDAEVTLECNPGTGSNSFPALVAAGFNRLSIGVQSVHDTELQALGRIHSFAQFAETFEAARAAGFHNINVDLMFGIPNQTLASWGETVETILALRPEHISAYGLKVEEGTPFAQLEHAGQLLLPEDAEERLMYRVAMKHLASAGYEHYEISNWSLPGYACKHNLVYWTCGEYVGLGAGAHSYLDGRRFGNRAEIQTYIDAAPDCVNQDEVYDIDRDEQMREYMMLGLRLNAGVSEAEFLARFGVEMRVKFDEQILRLETKGLIAAVDDSIRLTTHGLDFANEAFMEFV